MDSADPASVVEVHYRLTTRDAFRAASAASRYSRVSAAMGTFMVVLGAAAAILAGDVLSVLIAILGILLVSGLVGGTLSALGLRRRQDLLAHDARVRADPSGVRLSYLGVTSDATWPAFRRVRDTGEDFLFDFGTGAVTFVPSRAFSVGELAAFRQLMRNASVLDRRSSIGPMLSGIVVGALVAGVFMAVIIVLASQFD